MRHAVHTFAAWAGAALATILLPGCQAGVNSNSATSIQGDTAGFAAVQTPSHHHPKEQLVRVLAAKKVDKSKVQLTTRPVSARTTGEHILDLDSPDGISNYICAAFPRGDVTQVIVKNSSGKTIQKQQVDTSKDVSKSVSSSSAAFALGQHINIPPPGVKIDHTIKPKAGLNADRQTKADAVVSLGTSLDGTPYIWGHNEDRGQVGFDCSNFVAYVYHHALGYKLSGDSNVEWRTVGVTVPIWDMRKGDLLIFEDGKHVGIYSGNDQMIQCGGGLGKVGTLSLGPDSYWGNHLSAVRRMF